MSVMFNGGNDVITIPDNSGSLRPVNITVSIWKNSTQVSAGSMVAKPFNGPVWSGATASVAMSQTNGIRAMCSVSNGTGYSNNTCNLVSESNGTWYHFCMTYNGTMVTGYVNGVLMSTNTGSGVSGNIAYTSGKPWIIGADYSAAPYGNFFHGQLSELKIYNRALSAQEVNELATSRLKNDSVVSGLIGYWPLDEVNLTKGGSGITFYDRTKNNNHGIGSGSGLFGMGESYLSYRQGFYT